MEIVLLKQVESLGEQGSIVKVKPGYARNFLIPSGMAAAATPEKVKTIQEIARQRRRKIERAKTEAEALAQKIEAKPITLTLNLGEDEQTFGSVTAHDVVEALERSGFKLEKHAVRLDQPIKSLGAHSVTIKLHPEVTATLKVSVVKA